MKVLVSYVKSAAATTYVNTVAAVTYVKAVISTAYAGIAEAIAELLYDSMSTDETGYICFQDYVDPDMFATGDYVATSYQVF